MKITKIRALEVLDSRGNPTVQAYVYAGDLVGVASVPSGASTGSHEALELRDGDKKRFLGLGVLSACRNVEGVIQKAVKGMDTADLEAIDRKMIQLDGTDNKSKLGANAILAVSMASARLNAVVQNKPLYKILADTFGYKPKQLPTPMMNVINGGVHADSGLNIQEFMLVPRGKSFTENLRMGEEVYQQLKKILVEKKFSVAVGDEGGFAPHIAHNQAALDLLWKAIAKAGYKPGSQMQLSLDVAASEFYDKKKNTYDWYTEKKHLNSAEMVKLYTQWIKKYKLFSIEDGFAEDDFTAWKSGMGALGKHTILVGDDLFVTNAQRLQMGIDENLANAILIKLNQIGTVTETVSAIKLAQKNKFNVIVSHRSGETPDTFIADLSVAVNAEYIKTGSLARGERVAKYNRLLEIENNLAY